MFCISEWYNVDWKWIFEYKIAEELALTEWWVPSPPKAAVLNEARPPNEGGLLKGSVSHNRNKESVSEMIVWITNEAQLASSQNIMK